MTAKEDKKTPAKVGRVPGLILAQRWGRPSLAGSVLPYLPAARHRAVVARIFWKMGMVIGDYLQEYLRNNATSLSLKPISSGIPCPITFHGGRK